MGTFRCMDDKWRFQAHKDMLIISNKVESKYKSKIDFDIRKGYPSLYNNRDLVRVEIALDLALDILFGPSVCSYPCQCP